MLALTSPKGGGCSVCIVRSWTEAMEFSFVYLSNKEEVSQEMYFTFHSDGVNKGTAGTSHVEFRTDIQVYTKERCGFKS
jgi:hypothetical protein